MPQALRGIWVRFDTGDRWEVFSDAVSSPLRDYQLAVAEEGAADLQGGRIELVGENVARFEPADRDSFLLLRSSGANASASVTVYNGRPGSPAVAFEVTARDRRDLDAVLSAVTDSSGVATFDSLILGNEYIFTMDAQGGLETPLSFEMEPQSSGLSLGRVTLNAEQTHIKTSYQIENSNEWGYLFDESTYPLTIVVQNLGPGAIRDPVVRLEPGPGISIQGTDEQAIVGSISADALRSAEFVMDTAAAETTVEDRYVDVVVTTGDTDDGGTEWRDRLWFRVHRDLRTVVIRSAEDQINAALIDSLGRAHPSSSIGGLLELSVPLKAEAYTLLVAPDGSQTPYAFQVDGDPLEDGAGLEDSDIHEPNDTEDEAFVVGPNARYESYAATDDLDFFAIEDRFRLSENLVWGPVSPADQGTTTDFEPTLSWADISGASGYEVQWSLDEDALEGEPVTSVTESVYTLESTLEIDQVLYWRVRAAAAGGGYSAWSDVFAFTLAFTVGDEGPAGGVVFYDQGSYSDGWRYLEAAPFDQTDSGVSYVNSAAPWAPRKSAQALQALGAADEAVGAGSANTATIVASLGAGDYAARLCSEFEYGEYDDWFLPSREELDILHQNQDAVGGFNKTGAYYFSSSEHDADEVWVRRFSSSDDAVTFATVDYDQNSTILVPAKRAQALVRAVRRF